MNQKTVLIADDEERILSLVSDFLRKSGYFVLTADDGERAVQIFESEQKIDLAILDIMMPGIDGWEVCRRIRQNSDIPIILLSARSEEFDELTGFEAGADEYVTKPFSPAVLVKRVDALLRRVDGVSVKNRRRLIIDKQAYIAYLDGKALDLTLKEFQLLSLLWENAGRVYTRYQLLDAIWNFDFEGDFRTVDSHVARLRTKLGEFGNEHLKTVYGMGYKMQE